MGITNNILEGHMIHELHQIHFSLLYHALYRHCTRSAVEYEYDCVNKPNKAVVSI